MCKVSTLSLSGRSQISISLTKNKKIKWCGCMVGFYLGQALQQTSTLHVPGRGERALLPWASSASGAVFFFFSLFSLDSAHLIKAEIQDFKDVQISLSSSLTKPWPSWCFKKHMEGLRFHVSHKMCWFHKYQKVKRDLPAVFTFLQCLQKKGRIRCEKVCIQQC